MAPLWTDPRQIDYTDALNPLTRRGWSIAVNHYVHDSLNEPVMQGIRGGEDIEARLYVCPDASTAVIPPFGTYDFDVASDPYTWLYALNASSQQAEGFLIQITDHETGAQLFSAPVWSANLHPTTQRGVQCFLAAPRLYMAPSFPVVRIMNLSGSANRCQVNLFAAAELMESTA